MEHLFLVNKVLVNTFWVKKRLVTNSSLLIATLAVMIFGVSQSLQAVEPNQKIRFYKINNKGQADKIRFTASKVRKPGCHNFIKKVRVHRVVQIGYNACELYSAKNCKAESLIEATRAKEPNQRKTELSQGYSWFPAAEHKRGARLKSWSCE